MNIVELSLSKLNIIIAFQENVSSHPAKSTRYDAREQNRLGIATLRNGIGIKGFIFFFSSFPL